MKILAIETSSERGSVALAHGQPHKQQILVRRIDGAANHSATLLHHIEELCALADTPLSALDAVAFGAGPGAFTGLRLACGVAQGIALATGVGVAVVGSHQALALQAGAARVFTATDARMGELYHAAFELDEEGVPQVLCAPACSTPEALSLPAGRWVGVGSAFRVWKELLQARFGDAVEVADDDMVPRAEEVAKLAAHLVRAGSLVGAERAAPLYVRDKVAFTTAERLARGGRG